MTRAFGQLRDAMEHDQVAFLYDQFIAPSFSTVVIATSLSPSVTGSMNDFVVHAKSILLNPDRSPWDASHRLNRIPMGSLKYGFPGEVFRNMPGR